MSEAQDAAFTGGRFSLGDDGQISYQPDASNPLPGEAVARVIKGRNILIPDVELLDGLQVTDKEAAQAAIHTWLKTYVVTVLEPLVALPDGDEPQVVKDIAAKVFAALGIVPREELEDLIAQLDADTRRSLRSKKIRLGPILVFQPDLNKPAAVRLRAILWSLHNDKPLPAPVPKDGVVSYELDEAEIDKSFYQAIGYPVYGGRAIRIDMLDRVISAVYDGAEGGKFRAEHKMAEWLGSSIDGLYRVLEAMGHKKIYDPAVQVEKEAVAIEESQDNSGDPSPVAQDDSPQAAATENPTEDKPQEQVKPELATFRLKKGKAFEKEAPRPKRSKKDEKPKKAKGKRNKSTNRSPKVMSAGPEKRLEDSPFAVLGQLKKQGGEKD